MKTQFYHILTSIDQRFTLNWVCIRMKIFCKKKNGQKIEHGLHKETSKTEKYCRLVKTWSKQLWFLEIFFYCDN